jgi:bile acid:Na+ symporter, BASS family
VRIVLVTIIAPLTAGLLVRQVAPTFAKRVAGPLATSATVLLVGGVLPILFTTWPAIRSLVGNGTLAGIAAFVLIGLVAGHLLGGPEEDGRTLLALSSASRHPGIAMAAAHADFPQQTLVPAAIMLYLIVSAVVSMPYLSWRRRTRE